MKRCPACGTQYTDDTLRFCLQDGTPLGDSIGPNFIDAPADDAETVVSNRGRTTQPSNFEPVHVPHRERKRSNPVLVGLLVALGILFLFGAAGVAGWLYFRNQNREAARNIEAPTTNLNRSNNSRVSPSPSATPKPSPTTEPTRSEIDKERAERDISSTIGRWNSQIESGDLDAAISNYADRVDYFTKRGVSPAFIRDDKRTAFARFDDLRIDIGDIEISFDETGENATAVFDKEWEFEGERRSTGRVRSELRLRNVDGRWLIAGERDLKVY